MSDGYVQFTTSSGKTHTRKDDVDYDALLRQEQATSDAQANQYAGDATAANEAYKQSMGGAYDSAVDSRKQTAAEDAATTRKSYDSLFDANAAEQIAREQNLKAQMAHAGMTDSGWNATNQTAIAATRANADAGTRTARQNAVDAILRELRQYTADVETQKAQTAAAADLSTSQSILAERQNQSAAARQYAYNRYGTELDRQNAENNWRDSLEQQDYANGVAAQQYADSMAQQRFENQFTERQYADKLAQQDYENRLAEREYAAQVAAAQAETETSSEAYPSVYKSAVSAAYKMRTSNADGVNDAAKMIASITANDADITDSQLIAMCYSAGITPEDYENYLNSTVK